MIFVILLIALIQIFYILHSEIWLKRRFSFLLVTSSIYFITYYLPFFISLILNRDYLDINLTRIVFSSNHQINAALVIVSQFFAYLLGYKLLGQHILNKSYLLVEDPKKPFKLINFFSIISISACFILLGIKFNKNIDLYYHMGGLGWLYWIGIYFGMILLPINYFFNNCNRLLILNYIFILAVLILVFWRLSSSIYFIIILFLAFFSYFKKVNKPKLISTLFVIISILLFSELFVIIYNRSVAEFNSTNSSNTVFLESFIDFLYLDMGRYPYLVATYSKVIELAQQHTFKNLLIPFSCYFRHDDVCILYDSLGELLIFGKRVNSTGGITVSSLGEKILLFGFYGSFIISFIIGICNRYVDNLLFCAKKTRINLIIAVMLAMNLFELSPPKLEPLLISFLLLTLFLKINEKKINCI